VVHEYSLPRWERSSLADGALEFGTVRVLAGTGGRCKVRVLAGEQASPTNCDGLKVGGIRISQTSHRLPCGHGRWVQEEQRTAAGMWVLAGSCSGRFAAAQQELVHTHAVGTAQEAVA